MKSPTINEGDYAQVTYRRPNGTPLVVTGQCVGWGPGEQLGIRTAGGSVTWIDNVDLVTVEHLVRVTYAVEVLAPAVGYADQVMVERIEHDEDYDDEHGRPFTYRIDWERTVEPWEVAS